MLKRYPEIQGLLMEILKLSSKSADDLIRRKVLDDMVARVSLSVDKARLVELLAAMKGPLEEQYVANIMLLCDVEDLAVAVAMSRLGSDLASQQIHGMFLLALESVHQDVDLSSGQRS
ncbi:hypothetical protein HPB47_002739 [Ixodes persulcatus]|uniref:Uncharacterized protein n=1 Tax=Ixodes persulcatus TaxID=34615 RepID=A0AC60PKC8_IXOPE|nr:hypothetical protein HPB47_002739 [Ixodes persulcatus]